MQCMVRATSDVAGGGLLEVQGANATGKEEVSILDMG